MLGLVKNSTQPTGVSLIGARLPLSPRPPGTSNVRICRPGWRSTFVMRGLDPRIHRVGKKSLSKDAMGFELRHRFDVELRIIEQRQMDLMAHRRNVGLIEYQLGGLPPALAQFAASERQRQHIRGRLPRGWVRFWERYAAGNDMAHT